MKIYYIVLKYLRSIIFCLRFLPFKQAIKIPICITNNIKISSLSRNCIKIQANNIYRFMIIIGDGGSLGLQEFRGAIHIHSTGKLFFYGSAILSQGTSIRIDKDSQIHIGDNFYCNKNCYFRSANIINIKRNSLLGWNITMNTTDGHEIIVANKKTTNNGPIIIEEHVWIASNTTIGKNVYIPKGCIIAQNSLVIHKYQENNILIGGIPAVKIKSNINWIK